MDDAAQSGNIRQRAARVHHHDVASAGAQHLDQRAFTDSGGHRSHVDIKGAGRHNNAFRQTQQGRPLGRQGPRWSVRRQGVHIQPVT